MASMQMQLDALTAHAKASELGGPIPPPTTENQASNDSNVCTTVAKTPVATPLAKSYLRHAAQRFYGPTSPDYSMIAAQMRIKGGRIPSTRPDWQKVPAFDDGQTDDEDAGIDPEVENSTVSRQSARQQLRRGLWQFLNLLSKREAVRLLRVYHEVIGELHPICDIESLVKQLDFLYSSGNDDHKSGGGPESPASEDNMLILNLALTIALRAGSTSESSVERALYNACRDIINGMLESTATSTKHVVIALLVVSTFWLHASIAGVVLIAVLGNLPFLQV